ncbi:Alpha/Beta hydrolase protein [Aspergillus tamarii]|uniref:Alpha/Beta hydrolase protein n=1 Tax=Aspergillus tamarii TaxID=41984 RepID=A0A5N6UUS3_ASPTM|nr:Alpha/Beta hydrolase protein [Aspergillus tamarii]
MEPFKLFLPNGATIPGRYNFPPRYSRSAQIRPLIVCIPGGSYDSRCLQIPVIAIDRPGYGESTPAPDFENAPTYGQAQGIYLNSVVFPVLWQTFSDSAEASAIVLLSHSIGAMIATIAAGSYANLEDYPLAGIITSDIGSELFEATPKDATMLQPPHMNLAPMEIRQFTEQLNQPIPQGELRDINTTWLGYWKDYSINVKAPLLYGLGEFDSLWTCSAETLAVYKAAFPKSPNVTCEIVPMAPHCMEFSFQS